MNREEIKTILDSRGFVPSKRYGQNFLINKDAITKIADYAEGEKIVVEVGSGVGNLTVQLAKKAKKVISVEKDKRMTGILKEVLSGVKNVEIVRGDILDILKNKHSFHLPQKKRYKIIANLPYNVATAIIREFLECKFPPEEMILMLQKEVAQRICAKPPKMSILAISVQFYAKPEIIFNVSRNCFWPMPNVDSAVIKITPKKEKIATDKQKFFKILKSGFSRPRAQLLNNLSKELKLEKESVREWLESNNIRPEQRAETLSLEDWNELTQNSNY